MKHLLTRSAVIEFTPTEEKPGLMRAALSSDAPVKMRGGFLEVLRHDEKSIDLSRAGGRGLPITVGHSEMDPMSPELPVGRVKNISIDNDGKMRGDLEFDSDDRSKMVEGKVARGFAGLSVTYDPGPGKRINDTTIERRRWAPKALSVVSVEADVNAGVGRSEGNEEAPIVEEQRKDEEAPKARSLIEQVEEKTQAGYAAGMRAATERLKAITDDAGALSRAAPHMADQIRALATEASDDVNVTPESFRSLAIKLIGGGAQPAAGDLPEAESRFAPPGDTRRPNVQIRGEAVERHFRGLELAILERAVPGVVKPEDMEGNQYRGWSMLDVAREILSLHGHDPRGKSSEQIAKMAIGMRAISPGTAQYETTDFPALTENIGFKAAFEGFQRAERTWDMWCDTGSTPDFKQFTVPRLSHTSKLPIVAENANYTNLTRTDAKESGQAQKRGGLISYSWEATVNNDVNSFADQMQSSGEAAQATLDKDVYDLLLLNQGVGVSGPVMGDGNQLFSAAHSNIGTAALDLAGIIDARVKMGRQTDDNNEEIGPRLSYVLVPLELEDTAMNLATSEFLVDVGGAAQRANTVRNTFEVVATHFLTDTTDWFGASRRGQHFRVFFLNGVQAPTLERESAWDTDAMHYKVRVVYDVVPRDWRGMIWQEVAGA